MKQINMFYNDESDSKEQVYTSKIKAPIYEPKNKKPFPIELFDDSKTKRLIIEINNSSVPDEVKPFLIAAAHRHTVFNYSKAADFYAHSDKTVQDLMERSAMVIIDFEKAIQLGYVKLTKEIGKIYLEEHGE